MAFGNNIAERSRKMDLLKTARMYMASRMPLTKVFAQTRSWGRKTVAELSEAAAKERTAFRKAYAVNLPDMEGY